MEHSSTCQLDLDDAVALVGILAALEALILGGRLGAPEISTLRHSLELGGAVLPGSDEAEIAAALSAMNERLRATIE